jgi:hypothetical protein
VRHGYKRKAIIKLMLGLGALASIGGVGQLAWVGLPEGVTVTSILVLLAIALIFYFQGCCAIATGKGHKDAGIVAIILAGMFCPPVGWFLVPIGLWFALEDRHRDPSKTPARPRPRRHETQGERSIRYRRRALSFLFGGLLAVLAAGVLFFTGAESVQKSDLALVSSVALFVGGYVAVLNGAWHMLRLKGASSHFMLIGLIPVVLSLVGHLFILVSIWICGFTPFLLAICVLCLPAPGEQGYRVRRRRRPKESPNLHSDSESRSGSEGRSEERSPAHRE